MPAGSLAARVATWGDAALGLAVASTPSGGKGGVPFLRNVFPDARIWVEAAWGADLTGSPDAYPWQDVTADVMHGAKIAITQGRSDETSQAQPATCQFTLLNTGGRYTPYNPMAALYPGVRRGTPVRVRVDIGTGPYTLFQGSMIGATPAWNTSASLATVVVQAAGALRRITQGTTPLRSALYRKLVTEPGVVAYWPMEVTGAATQFDSAVAGAAPTAPSPALGNNAVAGFGGSAALGDFSTGAGFAFVAPVGTNNNWRIHVAFQIPNGADLSAFPVIAQWSTTGTNTAYQLIAGPSGSGGLSMTVTSSGSNAGISSGTTVNDGQWHQVEVISGTNAGNFFWEAYLDGQPAMGSGVGAGSAGHITGGRVNPSNSTKFVSIGHLMVQSPPSIPATIDAEAAPLYAAFTGHTGEAPGDRIIRICGEEGVPVTVVGTSSVAMGPQPVAALIDILRECEALDGGVLFDGFGAGVGLVTLASRYNQPAALTVDADADQVAPPFAAVDDDQRTRNDATASRSGGGSARVVQTDGPLGTDAVGTYSTSVSVNPETDAVLASVAGWMVHLGTVQGLRFPTWPLDFGAVPELAQAWLDATARPIGFRMDVLNVSDRATQAQPDDLLLIVEGYSHQIDMVNWVVTANCSPAAPYVVGVLDDTVLGHLDTAGCVLDQQWDGASASIFADTTLGPLWTTSGGDFPFDLNIGGQRVTVSNCTGASNPQTFTVSAASVNGVAKVHPPGEAVSLWSPIVLAL